MSRKSRIPQLAGTGLHALDTLPVADDSGSLAARSALAGRLSTLIDEQTRDNRDDRPAAMPAVVPRTLTLIRRYRLRRLSLDHLIRALVALDQHVEIVVRAKGDEDEGGIVTRIN
ncbi:XRE family transcriptional regulator [Cupriavidus sp. BIS7]|uniref:XRE family transcriptional regulator n=1 Tax=Cupriavidus sp. BIS7 TaxID=1217718 RepID=UPI0002EFBF55|nr:XRE family transcriptional regulator [Cupriavidus sp. BIS7]